MNSHSFHCTLISISRHENMVDFYDKMHIISLIQNIKAKMKISTYMMELRE